MFGKSLLHLTPTTSSRTLGTQTLEHPLDALGVPRSRSRQTFPGLAIVLDELPTLRTQVASPRRVVQTHRVDGLNLARRSNIWEAPTSRLTRLVLSFLPALVVYAHYLRPALELCLLMRIANSLHLIDSPCASLKSPNRGVLTHPSASNTRPTFHTA